ncbi:Hypothetical protein PMT_2867 [Prochlorococcus marinus str. MIT 9313]|uniref:Uncharacterized protein n=1 Tax=Prochlorococcus marinus (strain MIT 9313) TaxID=74547 RepID=B9ESN6_PROMM|nr:Hypothetical protein PMT_2867 [Prochlorococcus marinus str. MIT 9313]
MRKAHAVRKDHQDKAIWRAWPPLGIRAELSLEAFGSAVESLPYKHDLAGSIPASLIT